MKQNILAEKILPVIEDNLHLKFDIPSGTKVQRKQNDNGLVMDPVKEGEVVARMSTIDVDRSGEIVIPEGMDAKNFLQNPVTMWGHDYSQPPVGKITEIVPSEKAVYARLSFGSTPRCQELLTLCKEGILSAVSIGFVAKKTLTAGTKAFKDFIDANVERLGDITNLKKIITEWELLELSLVAIPCNQNAGIIMKKLGISEEVAKKFEVIEEPKKEDEAVVEPIKPEVEAVVEDPKEVEVKPEDVANDIVVPEIAFVETTVTKPEDVYEEVIADKPVEAIVEEVKPVIEDVIVESKPVEAIVEPYFRVISEPIEVLAEKRLLQKKGKLS